MKKILLFAATLFFVALNSFAQVQHPENCPFGGRENCTGYCGQFTDENGDGYCDYSILTNKKEDNQNTIKEDSTAKKAQINNENASKIKKTTEKKDNKNAYQTEGTNHLTVTAEQDEIQKENETIEEPSSNADEKADAVTMNVKKVSSPYHFWSIFLVTIVLYVLSVVLVRAKKIKKITQRKFWNIVLLITCLVSCLLGVYIVLAKMYAWEMNYMTVLKFHVDFGICMTIIAIIHILWHITYWKNIFKSAKQKSVK